MEKILSMPKIINNKKVNEKAWKKAKLLAKKQHKEKNFAYITTIYKNLINESLKYYLNEMAIPRRHDINKKYYHGTTTYKNAQNIIKEGIKPPDISLKEGNKFQPIGNKVYLTTNLSYAIIYAIGGHFLNTEVPKSFINEYGENGYLFIIDGKELKDIDPDEDSVGEIAYEVLNDYDGSNQFNFSKHGGIKAFRWLKELAYEVLDGVYPEDLGYKSDSDTYGLDMYQLLKRYDNYADLAASGKELIKYMNDQEKFQLIDLGAHISNTGIIKPIECWEINRKLTKKLKENGSNFFQFAKKINL